MFAVTEGGGPYAGALRVGEEACGVTVSEAVLPCHLLVGPWPPQNMEFACLGSLALGQAS